MINLKSIDELSRKITEALPDSLRRYNTMSKTTWKPCCNPLYPNSTRRLTLWHRLNLTPGSGNRFEVEPFNCWLNHGGHSPRGELARLLVQDALIVRLYDDLSRRLKLMLSTSPTAYAREGLFSKGFSPTNSKENTGGLDLQFPMK